MILRLKNGVNGGPAPVHVMSEFDTDIFMANPKMETKILKQNSVIGISVLTYPSGVTGATGVAAAPLVAFRGKQLATETVSVAPSVKELQLTKNFVLHPFHAKKRTCPVKTVQYILSVAYHVCIPVCLLINACQLIQNVNRAVFAPICKFTTR